MKQTTQTILKWLNSQSVNDQLTQFKQTNPTYTFNETTIDEAIEMYEQSKDLIIKSIEKEILDTQLPFTRRNQIHNQLKNITTQLSQLQQHKFNAANSNATPMAQAVITAIHTLNDVVDNCKLRERLTGFADYTNEIKELRRSRKTLDKLISEIENATKLYDQVKVIDKNIRTKSGEVIALSEQLESERTKSLKIKDEIVSTSELVKKSNQDVEDKKVKISAFFQNIEEYKTSITKLEEDAKRIIAKEVEIDRLIGQAERALNLKSAEGISAAFSSYYETAKKSGVVTIYKVSINLWIVGAILFIFAALGLTVWIVSGKWIDHPDAISSIIGRVIAVAISITGATFCARQYIKQKNILEDYAYKSVLAKSIIAFTDEIKKRDDKKVVDYLTTVLEEIHRDPLRTRDNKEENNVGLNASEIVEKLIDLIPKGK